MAKNSDKRNVDDKSRKAVPDLYALGDNGTLTNFALEYAQKQGYDADFISALSKGLREPVGELKEGAIRLWLKGDLAKVPLWKAAVFFRLIREVHPDFSMDRYVLGGQSQRPGAEYDIRRVVSDIERVFHRAHHQLEDRLLTSEGLHNRVAFRLSRQVRHVVHDMLQPTAVPQRQPDGTTASVDAYEPRLGGALCDPEIGVIEPWCKHVYLATYRFDYVTERVLRSGDKPPTPFAQIVADNIRRGVGYTYVVPGAQLEFEALRQSLGGFRRVLEGHGITSGMLAAHCKVYVTRLPIGAGFVIHEFDRDALRLNREAQEAVDFLEYLDTLDYCHRLESGTCVGHVMPGSARMRGGSLMMQEALDHAWSSFPVYVDKKNSRLFDWKLAEGAEKAPVTETKPETAMVFLDRYHKRRSGSEK